MLRELIGGVLPDLSRRLAHSLTLVVDVQCEPQSYELFRFPSTGVILSFRL